MERHGLGSGPHIEKPCPSQSEFKALLQVWFQYDRKKLSDTDVKIFTNFMDRESRERGHVDTMDAYQDIVING